MFDVDGVYNSQNDRIWAANRTGADAEGGIRQKRKFPQKVMILLGVCSKGVSSLIIFGKGTVDHDRYIKEVLPIALKFNSITTCSEDNGLINKMVRSPIPMQNRKNGALRANWQSTELLSKTLFQVNKTYNLYFLFRPHFLIGLYKINSPS